MKIHETSLTRRHFLALGGLSAGSVIIGCAVNPVTGKQQLMLVSEGEEKQIDRVNSPHQFSADYGPVQDEKLNRYVRTVGNSVGSVTHRSNMPYRYVPLNATYVNAYTFPAGSVGITRGILLELPSEAALAALIIFLALWLADRCPTCKARYIDAGVAGIFCACDEEEAPSPCPGCGRRDC